MLEVFLYLIRLFCVSGDSDMHMKGEFSLEMVYKWKIWAGRRQRGSYDVRNGHGVWLWKSIKKNTNIFNCRISLFLWKMGES